MGYAGGVSGGYVGEMGGGGCVGDEVEEVEIFFFGQFRCKLGGKGDVLHMLSIITRKFSSMSVMLYRSLIATSQLRIACTRSSYLDASASAALITAARLALLPVSSQSRCRAGCTMKPMSWVSVRLDIWAMAML